MQGEGVDKQGVWRKAVLVSGCITALLAGVPWLNFIMCLCCAPAWLGGLLAVVFLKSFSKGSVTIVSLGEGAKLGAVTGTISAVFTTLLSTIFKISGLAAVPFSALQKLLPEDQQTAFQLALEQSKNVTPATVGAEFVSSLLVLTIFATIGGLIGAAIFGKPASPPATSLDVPPPPTVTV